MVSVKNKLLSVLNDSLGLFDANLAIVAFALFQEKGIFNPEVANSFRTHVLSKGGTEHPMVLYKRFRGQEPSIDALLKRNGIINQ